MLFRLFVVLIVIFQSLEAESSQQCLSSQDLANLQISPTDRQGYGCFLALRLCFSRIFCFPHFSIDFFLSISLALAQCAGGSVLLERDGWEGHQLTSAVAGILLHDAMGYQVTFEDVAGGYGGYERCSQISNYFNFEVWPNRSVSELPSSSSFVLFCVRV